MYNGFKDLGVAVASFSEIKSYGNNVFDISIETDVAGTGAIDITASVNGSPFAPIEGVTSFDVADLKIKRIKGNFDAIRLTGNGILTSTTFDVYALMRLG